MAMTFEMPTQSDQSVSEGSPNRQGWGGPESEWHSATVSLVATYPQMLGVDFSNDPIERVWHDNLVSNDGTRFWRCLRTQYRPDVIFEHASGSLSIIEVEPLATLAEGIAQLAGDYLKRVEVDNIAASRHVETRGFLVTESIPADMHLKWIDFLNQESITWVASNNID